MKKLLILLIVAIAGIFFFRFVFGSSEDSWICQDGRWIKHGQPSAPMPVSGCGEDLPLQPAGEAETPVDDQIIGGDQDEHGCLIAAGYSWCEATQKCHRPWEETCE